jgi:tRNA(Ile)-lysidine synthase
MGSHAVVKALGKWDYWSMLDGGRIIVACSGGPDSTALACAVAEYIGGPESARREWRAPPQLVLWHLDHMLRETSARDARFVKQLGRKLGTRVVIEREDVRAAAHERAMNVEALARERRYALLERLCEQEGERPGLSAPAYAFTAHHMNDQAETVLMRLLRGAQARGLRGILAQYGGCIHRPWLGVRREQILDYLESIGQDYVVDETNEDISRYRNLIRHAVLPVLERISPKAVERIAGVPRIAQHALSYIGAAVRDLRVTRLDQDALARCLPLLGEPWGKYSAHITPLAWSDTGVLLGYVLEQLSEEGVQLDAAAAANVREQGMGELRPAFLREWSLRQFLDGLLVLAGPVACGGTPARQRLRKGSWSIVGKVRVRVEDAPAVGLTKIVEQDPQEDYTFAGQRSWPEMMLLLYAGPPENAEWECYLADSVRLPLSVRSWCPGDRIRLAGGGTKKLSDVFIDTKIPRAFRHVWMVLVDAGDEVLWVPGLADSVWMALGERDSPAHRVQIKADPPYDAMFRSLRTRDLLELGLRGELLGEVGRRLSAYNFDDQL